MADDYYSWADRRNRPEAHISEVLKKHDLDGTQPIEVKEADLSDTAVLRMRKAMLEKNR